MSRYPERNQSEYQPQVQSGESGLNAPAVPYAAVIDRRQHHDGRRGYCFLLPGSEGKEGAQILGHADSQGGDTAGLLHQEQHPAAQETCQWSIGGAQVDVLPAGLRHHGGQFREGYSSEETQNSGYQPHPEPGVRCAHLTSDLCRHNEDGRADHDANNNSRSLPGSESANETGLVRLGSPRTS